jgi:transmembrane sensor
MSNAQILEEAAAWFVELVGDDIALDQRKAFDQWMRRSPEHIKAFLELVPIWEAAAARNGPTTQIDELIALARQQHVNVVSITAGGGRSAHTELMPETGHAATGIRGAPRSWSKLGAMALAACLAVICLAATLYLGRNTYATDIGEQRSVTLSDGSLLQLNADSKVEVRLTDKQRSVELIRGQALFSVAHDVSRPFIVHSGRAQIRAVGTQFDVYRKHTGTTVTVVEGRVTVSALPEDGTRSRDQAAEASRAGTIQELNLLLDAGEQTTVKESAARRGGTAAVSAESSSENTGEIRLVDLAAATAWTEHRLMFQKATLADVADEFNRYNTRKLVIVDPKTRQFLISGTFSSTDPASLLRFLKTQPGMHVIEGESQVRIDPSP